MPAVGQGWEQGGQEGLGVDHRAEAGTMANDIKARLALSAWAEMESLWSSQPNPTQYKSSRLLSYSTEVEGVCVLFVSVHLSGCTVSAFVGCAIKEIFCMLACECGEGDAFLILLNNTDCSVLC